MMKPAGEDQYCNGNLNTSHSLEYSTKVIVEVIVDMVVITRRNLNHYTNYD